MSILKVVEKDYVDEKADTSLMHYILKQSKTPSNCYGGINVTVSNIDEAAKQFKAVRDAYGFPGGNQLVHFILAFEDNEINTTEDAWKMGCAVTDLFASQTQMIFAYHEDTDNPHIHFLANAVQIADGNEFQLTGHIKKKINKAI